MPHGRTTTAVLAAVAAAGLWGTTGTAQALGPDAADPLSVGALRVSLGALVLLLLAVSARARTGTVPVLPPGGPSLPGWAVLLLGGLCVATYQAGFFVGVSRAGVAVGTVVALGLAPVATGLLAIVLGERPDRRWVFATAVAVAGVAMLVVGATGPAGRADALGVTAAAVAGVSYAGYTITARSLLVRGVPGVAVMAGFFGVGALMLAPTLFLVDVAWVTTARGLAAVLWLGVVATALAYVLFQHALARLSARTVATLSLAEPVTAALLGVLLLREHLSATSVLGLAVVVAGLVLVSLPTRGGGRSRGGAARHTVSS
ncbi:DMT family transporter [Ornithinimicrobium avium]|uniref:DMT family transporter n=1 Tax=Ornithinimicrobium avium TaxID=2283195 RepID=UPI0013B3DF94|nr:EamA family transporter [Ornithinimicrobium avium]